MAKPLIESAVSEGNKRNQKRVDGQDNTCQGAGECSKEEVSRVRCKGEARRCSLGQDELLDLVLGAGGRGVGSGGVGVGGQGGWGHWLP